MLYKYKEILLAIWFVTMLWIGYVSDLAPRQLQYHALTETHAQLAASWQREQVSTQVAHPSWTYSPKESSFLSFTKQIQKANLQIVSIKSITPMESHFTLRGSLAAWQAFLHALATDRFVFELKNIMLRQDGDQMITIELDAVLPLDHVTLNGVHKVSFLEDWHLAFCEGASMSETAQDGVRVLKTTSIRDMKMTAYLARDKQVIAWIELPDHALIEVFASAVIGKEKATVMNIQPAFISLALPNHSTVAIPMVS